MYPRLSLLALIVAVALIAASTTVLVRDVLPFHGWTPSSAPAVTPSVELPAAR